MFNHLKKAAKICSDITFSVLITLLSCISLKAQTIDTANLVIWLRADTGVVQSGSLVSSWQDQSGHGHHVLQSSGLNQPLIINSLLNNYPGIEFDGSSNYLTGDTIQGIDTSSISVFIVADGSACSGDVFRGWFAIKNHQFDVSWETQLQGVSIFNSNNYTWSGIGKLPASGFIPTIISVRKERGVQLEQFINGSLNYTNSSAIFTSDFTNNIFEIGRTTGSWAGYYKGHIYEIMVFNKKVSDLASSTIINYLRNKYAPPVNLGPDININYGFCDTTIDAGSGFISYLWSTGDTTSSISVNKPGKYWVSVNDIFGYTSSDTVNVSYPTINTISASSVCLGDTINWDTGLNNGYTFLYQDNSINNSQKITQAGDYWVKATDSLNCSIYSDTITIGIDSFALSASLGPDTSLCSGNAISLISDTSGITSYLWSDGSTNNSLPIQNSGDYWVKAINSNGCSRTDTVSITLKGNAPTVDFIYTGSCEGNSTQFTDLSTPSGNSLQWTFGDPLSGSSDSSTNQNPIHLFTDSGTYQIMLKAINSSGCSQVLSKNIKIYPNPIADFTNNHLCSGSTTQFIDVTNSFSYPISKWQWNFDDISSGANNSSSLKNPTHVFSSPGDYNIKLTVTVSGCEDSTTHFVRIYPSTVCFEPNELPNLELWLKADSGIVSNASNEVSQWMDQSGNNRNCSQSSSLAQPLFINKIIALNNKPAIHFDGNSDLLQANTAITIGTAFIVSNWMGGGAVFPFNNGLITSSTSTNPIFVLTVGGGSSNFYTGAPYVTMGTSIYKNGNPSTSYAPLSKYKITRGEDISTHLLPGIIIGKNPYDGGNTYWNGDIAEIIIYKSVLDASDCQKVEQYLRYKYAPPVNLGPDIIIKYGFAPVLIDAGSRFTSFAWNTGNNSQTLSASIAGNYSVTVTDVFDYSSSDSINVSYPLINTITDKIICIGDSFIWDTKLGNDYTFLWSDGSQKSSLTISKGGKYWVTVSDTLGYSKTSDTITVAIDSFPQIASLGPDTSLCTGNFISLKQGANGVQDYLWNDASTKSSLSIQSAGQYWVKATNNNGCFKRDTINISIKGTAPTPLFSADSITCQKNQIQFKDASTVSSGNSIIGWNWNFGDNTISTSQNPTHIYADTGNYIASLTITANTGCSNTILKNITTNPLPTVDFSNTGACSKANIQLNDLSIVIGSQLNNWNWNFGDISSGINNNSVLRNPTHLYSDSGNYTIHLIVKSTKGCIDSISKTIHIKPSPIANFTSTLGCTKEPVIFTNTSIIPPPETISNRSWDFHNGKTSTLPNPKQTYSSTGTYDVTLKITASNGCSSDTTKTININDKPFADYTFNNNCLNSASIFTDMSTVDNDSIIKWNWKFSNSDISLLQNPSYTFKDTGNYPVRLLVVSSAGCTDSVTKKVSIKPLPIADFSFNPMFGNSPLNVNFTNQSSGASSYVWNFGDGDGDSLSSNPAHLFQDTGRYTIALTAIDNKGCFSSATQLLQVSPEFIDIALLDVKTTIDNNNYLSISIGMLNMGTRPINYLELLVKADGNLAIKETWTGTLNTGEYTTYNFNSSVQLAGNNSYVCISLVNPNFTTDDNPNNNEQCLPLQQDVFMVPNPYPNPVADKLTIPVIVPSDGEVEISLVDFKADIVINKVKLNALKGFNRIIFNTSDLEEGIYLYTVRFNGEETIKRFVKIGI